jgi:hypothetical protein
VNLRLPRVAVGILAGLVLATLGARAQTAKTIPPLPNDYVLLTIFFRHDESRPLPEINKELAQRNWARDFPPACRRRKFARSIA